MKLDAVSEELDCLQERLECGGKEENVSVVLLLLLQLSSERDRVAVEKYLYLE